MNFQLACALYKSTLVIYIAENFKKQIFDDHLFLTFHSQVN